MIEPYAFTVHWLRSMRTISRASRLAKKRRANCCTSRSKCASSFPAKIKLPKRSRARPMPTRRTSFTCCGIWRATIHGSRSSPVMKLRMIVFRSENRVIRMDNSSEAPTDVLTVPWSDTVRFVRQLSHDLRNDLNAMELQSAYIGELAQGQELINEIRRLREVVSGLNSTLQML